MYIANIRFSVFDPTIFYFHSAGTLLPKTTG